MSEKIYEPFGVHVICNMDGIDFEKLEDVRFCLETMTKAIELSGATILDVIYHKFEPVGLSLNFLLSESHLNSHHYSTEGKLYCDIMTCGSTCNPEIAIDYLIEKFSPKKVHKQIIERRI
jgi:S-adenosylmethionine decarboxylase